jgi:hypothetical protein
LLKAREKPTLRVLNDFVENFCSNAGGEPGKAELPSIVKGMTPDEAGTLLYRKWKAVEDGASGGNVVGISTDLIRMDQSVGVQALKFQHAIHLAGLSGHDRRKYQRLLNKQLKTNARMFIGKPGDTRAILKWQVEGGACSGDMDTSLRACCLAVLIVLKFVRSEGITNFQIADNGDDIILIIEEKTWQGPSFSDRLKKWWLRFGFQVKLENIARSPEEMTFCRTQPVWDGETWTLVRDPRIYLSKDILTTKSIQNEAAWNTQRRSVAFSGKAIAGNLPVYCEFYKMLMRGAEEGAVDKNQRNSGLWRWARGMSRQFAPPTDASRFSFFKAFGITPDQQVILEEYYRSIVPEWTGSPRVGCFRQRDELSFVHSE